MKLVCFLSCDKKNLKWIFISYNIYETCVFFIPSPKAWGYKTHNSFNKYPRNWKFTSDLIYMYWQYLSMLHKEVSCPWRSPPCSSMVGCWCSYWDSTTAWSGPGFHPDTPRTASTSAHHQFSLALQIKMRNIDTPHYSKHVRTPSVFTSSAN